MNYELSGRRVLVTAASRGLGFATAEAFLREGCHVAISSSNADRINASAETLRAIGGSVAAMAADLSSAQDCARLMAWVETGLGGLDVLVNNTRGPALGVVEDLSDDEWEHAFQLVLMSAVRLTRRALPLLRQSGAGAVVNLTSIAAHLPLEKLALSNALRPGVVAVGKTLAREAAPSVRVNSILTGRFATDRILEENKYRASDLGVTPEEVAAMSVERIPLRRYGDPSELAAAVVFLASDAASFITGATLAVDGGEYPALF